MILVLKQGADEKKVEELKQQLMAQGLKLHLSEGINTSLIGLIGDTTEVSEDWLNALDVIESVKRIKEPYKKASKKCIHCRLFLILREKKSVENTFR